MMFNFVVTWVSRSVHNDRYTTKRYDFCPLLALRSINLPHDAILRTGDHGFTIISTNLDSNKKMKKEEGRKRKKEEAS